MSPVLPAVIVAVIAGVVPTSPAGVSIAHRDTSSWATGFSRPIRVKLFPAPSLTVATVRVVPVCPATDTTAISFVPDDRLVPYVAETEETALRLPP